MDTPTTRYRSRILREMKSISDSSSGSNRYANPFHSPPSSTGSHGTVSPTMTSVSSEEEGDSTRHLNEEIARLTSKNRPLFNLEAAHRKWPEFYAIPQSTQKPQADPVQPAHTAKKTHQKTSTNHRHTDNPREDPTPDYHSPERQERQQERQPARDSRQGHKMNAQSKAWADSDNESKENVAPSEYTKTMDLTHDSWASPTPVLLKQQHDRQNTSQNENKNKNHNQDNHNQNKNPNHPTQKIDRRSRVVNESDASTVLSSLPPSILPPHHTPHLPPPTNASSRDYKPQHRSPLARPPSRSSRASRGSDHGHKSSFTEIMNRLSQNNTPEPDSPPDSHHANYNEGQHPTKYAQGQYQPKNQYPKNNQSHNQSHNQSLGSRMPVPSSPPVPAARRLWEAEAQAHGSTMRSFILPDISHLGDFVSGQLQFGGETKNGVPILVKHGKVVDVSQQPRSFHAEVDGFKIPQDEEKLFVSLDMIRDEIVALQDHDAMMQSHAETLQGEVDRLHAQVQDLRDHPADGPHHEETYRAWRQEKKKLQDEVSSLRQQLARDQKKLIDSDAAKATLTQEREMFVKKLQEACENISDLMAKLEASEQDLKRTKKQLEVAAEGQARAELQADAAQKQLDIAVDGQGRSDQLLTTLRKQLAAALDAQARSEQEGRGMQDQLDAAVDGRQRAEKKLQSAQKQLDTSLETQYDQEQQMETLRKQLDLARAKNTTHREAKRAEYAVVLENERLREEVAQLRQQQKQEEVDRLDVQNQRVPRQTRQQEQAQDHCQTLEVDLSGGGKPRLGEGNKGHDDDENHEGGRTSKKLVMAVMDTLPDDEESDFSDLETTAPLDVTLSMRSPMKKSPKKTALSQHLRYQQEEEATLGHSSKEQAKKKTMSPQEHKAAHPECHTVELTHPMSVKDNTRVSFKDVSLTESEDANEDNVYGHGKEKVVHGDGKENVVHGDGKENVAQGHGKERTKTQHTMPSSSSQARQPEDSTQRRKQAQHSQQHSQQERERPREREQDTSRTAHQQTHSPTLNTPLEPALSLANQLPTSRSSSRTSHPPSSSQTHPQPDHPPSSDHQPGPPSDPQARRQHAPEHCVDQNCVVCANMLGLGAVSSMAEFVNGKKRVQIPRPIPVSEREAADAESAHEKALATIASMDMTIRPSQHPGHALALVIKALEDEAAHLSADLGQLQHQYNQQEAGSSRRARRDLASRIRTVLRRLEAKNDQIYALFDVLEGQRAVGQAMTEEELEMTVMSITGMKLEAQSLTWTD